MTYTAISSHEYLPYYRELYKSIKEHSPNSKQILYYIGEDFNYWKTLEEFEDASSTVIWITDWYNDCDSSYNTLEKICSLRARVVLNAFEKENDKVIFCGAKLKFFSQPRELQRLLHDGYDAVVTPHILEPLPEDGKLPSNASVSFTGHISTDLVGFRNTPEIVKFLQWQDEIMKTKCMTTEKTYLDQSWLNFLPFFVDNVKILRDPSYNIAYWNYKQRGLRKFDNNWYVKTNFKIIKQTNYESISEIVYDKMVCFQFSGLPLSNPERISTHQNREVAEGDFLEFLTDYAERIKSNEEK